MARLHIRFLLGHKTEMREHQPMSALGQKQTSASQNVMSALPPKADMGTCDGNFRQGAGIRRGLCDVRFTPAGADGLDWHPLAGLQQRLEIAKHPRPTAATLRGVAATRHHAGDHRRTSDVVSNGDRAHTALALVELVREARRRLRREIRVEERVPSLHKLSWGIAFNDFADDDLIGHSHRLHLSTGAMGEAAAGLKFIFYAATITILLGPFGQSDRIPNRPSACIDNNAVELGCARFVHSSHLRRLSNLALIGLRISIRRHSL
jgi:hypothetical protein